MSSLEQQWMHDIANSHKGTEPLSINNSKFQRWKTLVALKITARLLKSTGPCQVISRHKIVKSGIRAHLTEAQTLKYIAENTNVPVPKVYCAFVHRERAYIVMERIRGQELSAAWEHLSSQSREKVLAQLGDIIRQMRRLKPPTNTGIESCIGGSLNDPRMPRSIARFGPFSEIQAFHRWLREDFDLAAAQNIRDPEAKQEIREMVLKQDSNWPAPIFTHADLNPSNTLVRGDEIVSIIDWECSGWYPCYWEYTSAWYGNRIRTYWRDLLMTVLEPFPEELKMEITRQKWWGDF